MKNYVIINGVNSLTITGLAISKLPSISKPPLRVLTEEINGRDGDLITELGYGAYDKELVIGLYGNYDINEVIGFFNQEGTIVFSNENDKYYNFKIINQIDYEALIKFRTATINLHCQPFKYPLTETPEEITTEYVEDEGETITLNNTKIAPLSIDLKGNTTQNGTPTPSSPVNVNVVSGDNEVVVCGKNLFDKDSCTTQVGYFSSNGAVNSGGSSTITTSYTRILPNTQMYLGGGTSTIENVCYYDKDKNFIERTTSNPRSINKNAYYIRFQITTSSLNLNTLQLEVGSTATTYEPYTSQNYPLYLGVENLFNNTATTQTIRDVIFSINEDKSITANGTATGGNAFLTVSDFTLNAGTYTLSSTTQCTSTAYLQLIEVVSGNPVLVDLNNKSSNTFTINETKNCRVYFRVANGTTLTNFKIYPQLEKGSKANTYNEYGASYIELNKIGTYQDYIYKTDKWYLHKEIGKVVLNGSENWEKGSDDGNRYYFFTASLDSQITSTTGISNYFPIGYSSSGSCINLTLSYAHIRLFMLKTLNIDSVATLTQWLTANNTTLYYVLGTPTEEEITNTNLINQLEAIKGAMSYEGQTNISQVNNDLPFILKVKGTKEGSGEGIINNIGNIYAKPIIELEGTGNIGIYKNGTQYFEVDMSSDNEITIDTEKMEAYHNGVLKNRKVIGDYNKFTIDEGNNNIEITGELTKATITKYVRYL